MSGSSERILVRAPVGVVYATLTDVDGWESWWRGCRTERIPVPAAGSDRADDADHHVVVLGGRWSRRTLQARIHGWRHDAGLRLGLQDRRGRVLGEAEFWLEACGAGTLVHHILHDHAQGRPQERYRRAVRGGMQDLKDHLELAVVIASGRLP